MTDLVSSLSLSHSLPVIGLQSELYALIGVANRTGLMADPEKTTLIFS